ncbi:MAG TPA: phospholipase D-like domain-containing protein, partial [Phototrophicaceae bacterium]|nr:phospholipase D-like domain-containing protein [Phototrophicaceae bacterium]
MTKKRSSNKGNPIVRAIVTILTGIVVLVAVVISNATGFDLLGALGLSTPAATQPAGQNSTPIQVTVPSNPGSVTTLQVGQGFGAAKGFWQVYFTAPTGSTDKSTYVNGIDYPVAQAIDGIQKTLDITAFEWNSSILTTAVINAKKRGVTVRVVADNEHTLEDEDSTISQLVNAGIPVVYDKRSAFMHDKIMIMDSTVVWMGSTNWTINDVYRNNNNLLMLRSKRAVDTYQAEFNEMFEQNSFGPRSPSANTANYVQDGIPIQIFFASENPVMQAIITEVGGAQSKIRFMAFSFTYTDLGNALINKAKQGVNIEGVFENTGSNTAASELKSLFCAGMDVRTDGNK